MASNKETRSMKVFHSGLIPDKMGETTSEYVSLNEKVQCHYIDMIFRTCNSNKIIGFHSFELNSLHPLHILGYLYMSCEQPKTKKR
jgi:hypothetical protein